jgi:hypothetical protein
MALSAQEKGCRPVETGRHPSPSASEKAKNETLHRNAVAMRI